MKVLVIGDLSVSVAAETPRLPRPGENLILRNPTLIASGVAANISADLRGEGSIPTSLAWLGGMSSAGPSSAS